LTSAGSAWAFVSVCINAATIRDKKNPTNNTAGAHRWRTGFLGKENEPVNESSIAMKLHWRRTRRFDPDQPAELATAYSFCEAVAAATVCTWN
jgi:hypothetical protein